jgi:hypothetical protein
MRLPVRVRTQTGADELPHFRIQFRIPHSGLPFHRIFYLIIRFKNQVFFNSEFRI